MDTLTPRKTNGDFFALFEDAAKNNVEGARLLSRLCRDFSSAEQIVAQLHDLEHKGDEITHAMYTTLNKVSFAGGRRIIHTMGTRFAHLEPIHGFAAETSAAVVIQAASRLGYPLSTTHVISASILGVGAARRMNAVRWEVVRTMVGAWILTIPVTAALGFAAAFAGHALFH